MSSNMLKAPSGKPHLLFSWVIVFFICFNLAILIPRLKAYTYLIQTHQIYRVGHEFLWLAPYLKNAPWAGFVTCLNSSHPFTDVAIMGPYQEAQFVLSPTLVDYFHPLDHPYIIFVCPQEAFSQPLNYITLKKVGRVSLLYRKKN